jgi:hypothetical protein
MLLESGLLIGLAGITWLGARYPRYFLPLFLFSASLIMAAFYPVPSIHPLYFILVGGILLFCFLLIRLRATSLRATIQLTVHSLAALCEQLFDFFLQPTAADQVYLFEKRFHDKKMHFMRRLQRLRASVSSTPFHPATWLLQHLERVYDILLESAQLRMRVGDQTTWQVCAMELSTIANVMQQWFRTIQAVSCANMSLPVEQLAVAIMRLEENNDQILQVIAPDPLCLHSLFIV